MPAKHATELQKAPACLRHIETNKNKKYCTINGVFMGKSEYQHLFCIHQSDSCLVQVGVLHQAGSGNF